MSTASTLRTLADAIEILDNPAPMPKASTIDFDLLDSMVLLASEGLLESVLTVSEADKPVVKKSATIAPAKAPAKARKASKPAKAATKPKAKKAATRSTMSGKVMLSDPSTITDGQYDRITKKFTVNQIKGAVKLLDSNAKSLRGLSMADASDLNHLLSNR